MTFYQSPRWGTTAHAPGEIGHEPDNARAATGHASAAHDPHPHAHDHDHDHAHGAGGDHKPHESPWVMLAPLLVLAAGAALSGVLFQRFFIGSAYDGFWRSSLFAAKDNHVLHDMHGVPEWVAWSPTLAMASGFGLAYLFYIARPTLPAATARKFQPIYKFLLNKWYFDELYDWLFVRPTLWLGRQLWRTGDGRIIDGLGPDGISARVLDATRGIVKLQTGYVYHYAFAMLIGVALLVTWFNFGNSAPSLNVPVR